MLQKGYTVDFLTKKRVPNNGEIPQYYVENSHPAIIEPDEFDAVQVEIERRKKLGRPASCSSPFSARLICKDCGRYYGSKVWGSNTKYRRNIWRCNNKYKGEEICQTPHITEEELKNRFLGAFTKLIGSRDELIANIELAKTVLCDCDSLNIEVAELQNEMEIVSELSRKAIFENAHAVMNQEEFNARNDSYLLRHKTASEKITELENLRRERYSKALLLDRFISEIRSRPLVLTEFDIDLWTATIDLVTVTKDDKLIFEFKDGSKIEN